MKFLADENFDNRIVRGLLRRQPDLDIVRVQDLEIAGASDLIVLEWATQTGRILLTHDKRTIPNFVYERLAMGKKTSGVFIAGDNLPINMVIEEVLLIVEGSSAEEWINKLQRLPL
jgi:predicted nuclease of predicted toxin-antitoxin system